MLRLLYLILVLSLTCQSTAFAFGEAGCGAGQCGDCHSLTPQEAENLFQGKVDRVLSVEFAEMPGTWIVEVENQGKRFPLYLDFSKKYVVAGNIYRISDNRNIAQASQEAQAPERRVDIAKIPLGDALLLGDPMAATQVIVFTDPQCPFCKKLHAAMQEVVRRDPNIAFRIKLFPLKIHPQSYAISKSILCNKSLELLEQSFAGQPIPPALCEAPEVDQTLELVKTLGINSTPTLVLPDGRVVPGAKSAADLLKLLGSKAVSTGRMQ